MDGDPQGFCGIFEGLRSPLLEQGGSSWRAPSAPGALGWRVGTGSKWLDPTSKSSIPPQNTWSHRTPKITRRGGIGIRNGRMRERFCFPEQRSINSSESRLSLPSSCVVFNPFLPTSSIGFFSGETLGSTHSNSLLSPLHMQALLHWLNIVTPHVLSEPGNNGQDLAPSGLDFLLLGFLKYWCLFSISSPGWDDVHIAAIFQCLPSENLAPETVPGTEPQEHWRDVSLPITASAGQVQPMLKTATGRDDFCCILSSSQELVWEENPLDFQRQRKRKAVFNKIKNKGSWNSGCL